MSTGRNGSEKKETVKNFDAKRILYIDSHLAVFNKACADICEAWTEDSKESKESYLPFIFAQCLKSLGNVDKLPSFIHCFNRLDRPVSGAVLLVFDKTLIRRLQNQFTEQQKASTTKSVRKIYKALLEGCIPPSNTFTLLEHCLRFDAKKQKSFVCSRGQRKAKKARLLWRPVFCTDRYTLVEIELLTGRTHQIRCQLAHEGYHIKGDVKYGSRRSDSLAGIRLHASRLCFEHPLSGSLIDVHAPLLEEDALWQACGDGFDGGR